VTGDLDPTTLLLAVASAGCIGSAHVPAKLGLRHVDARSGAAISVPTAMLLFAVCSPFMLELARWVWPAAALFAVVGFIFPAAVTMLMFESNDRLGPVVTSTVLCTAPVFALAAAVLLLGERVPGRAYLATLGVVAGVALCSWKSVRIDPRRLGWSLVLPVVAAAIRGCAQALAKAGLALWPNPFAAGFIGYVMSSVTVLAADRLPAGRRGRPVLPRGFGWFVLTGSLNGTGLLFMYMALTRAPVSLVAPIIAAYPLATLLASVVFLREEALGRRVIAGALLTVAAIVYLVGGG
jgi:drug/metabolite transporter (DMT)-like permease